MTVQDAISKSTVVVKVAPDSQMKKLPQEMAQRIAMRLKASTSEGNDKDKDKSEGVLFPAAQLIVNKEGELQWELNQNPWKLVNVIEWE